MLAAPDRRLGVMSETDESPAAPIPTRLVLVRHGESVATVERRIGGPRTCVGLSELGVRQAERLATRLAETHEVVCDALYSSGYPRARQTAQVLAPVLDCDVRVEDGFGEHDPGPVCDGMSFDDFVATHGRPDWESDPYAVTFPDGETVADFHHRVLSTLRVVLDRHAGGSVMVVCHGGVVDTVLRAALRAPWTGMFELYTTNTSMTELISVAPGRWRLVRYNDGAHLRGLPLESPRAAPRAAT